MKESPTSRPCPQISVLMGVYNCEKTLSAAIDSLLLQTFSDWELILCDDGSSDGSYELARTYAEKYPDKLLLLRHEENKGLNQTLNDCLRAARGEFIARQDADDRSTPDRFEKEVAYLRSNPACAFVSTGMKVFGKGSALVGCRVPREQRPKKEGFLKSNQFFHAPVMLRRSVLEEVGGYTVDKRLLRVEDYNLWCKIYAKGYYGENIKKCLYEVTEDDQAYKRRRFRDRVNGVYALTLAIRMLDLPTIGYLYAGIGILKGFVPNFLYRWLHRRKLRRSFEKD